MKYAKIKNLKYVIAKTAVFHVNIAISVENKFVGNTVSEILGSRLKLLVSSGIYQLYEKWYSMENYPQWSKLGLYQLLRNENVDPNIIHQLSMNTNIVLALFICLVV